MTEKSKLKSYEIWLKYAKSDLLIAEVETDGVLFETRCFHAQQAVEKVLKAVLIAREAEKLLKLIGLVKLFINYLKILRFHPSWIRQNIFRNMLLRPAIQVN
jgi:HEPN domain-containing protein